MPLYVFSGMVGMVRCAIPARVVAGGTNTRATLAFEEVAPKAFGAARGADIAAPASEYLLTFDLQPAFQPLFWVYEFENRPISPIPHWQCAAPAIGERDRPGRTRRRPADAIPFVSFPL